jgi:hypothetical protein
MVAQHRELEAQMAGMFAVPGMRAPACAGSGRRRLRDPAGNDDCAINRDRVRILTQELATERRLRKDDKAIIAAQAAEIKQLRWAATAKVDEEVRTEDAAAPADVERRSLQASNIFELGQCVDDPDWRSDRGEECDTYAGDRCTGLDGILGNDVNGAKCALSEGCEHTTGNGCCAEGCVFALSEPNVDYCK